MLAASDFRRSDEEHDEAQGLLADLKKAVADLEQSPATMEMARVTAVKEARISQKRLDDVEVAHQIIEEELRSAVQTFRESEVSRAEVEQILLGRRAQMAQDWLLTPEGEARLDEEGTSMACRSPFIRLCRREISPSLPRPGGCPI
ncbi:unnamed protein product [Cuscuta europaea]|uniref:Uncharacterized protein n=1 Tax=Cuscuta europaea TaxID=41803 RepID=A0A9P0ZDK2_CUSEU|nr:unnamed protein product [Cuscuta europaea]